MENIKDLLSYEPTTGVFTWLVSRGRIRAGDIAGAVHCKGYVRIQVFGKHILAHRLAWFFAHGDFPTMQIDHINGVKTDNRIKNLRDVDAFTNSQNIRVAKKISKSGVLGVEQRGDRWRASIRVNGKKINLGTMGSKEAAHKAYIDAKRLLHPGCSI